MKSQGMAMPEKTTSPSVELWELWKDGGAWSSPEKRALRRKKTMDLLAKGADPGMRVHKMEWNALAFALVNGGKEEFQAMLKSANKKSLDERVERNGVPLLVLAVQAGDKESAIALLKAGANPNARGTGGGSALSKALELDSMGDLIEELLKAGADPLSKKGSNKSDWEQSFDEPLEVSLKMFKAIGDERKKEISVGPLSWARRMKRAQEEGQKSEMEDLRPVMDWIQRKGKGGWESEGINVVSLLLWVSLDPERMMRELKKAGAPKPGKTEAEEMSEMISDWLWDENLERAALSVSEWIVEDWDPVEELAWRHQTLGRAKSNRGNPAAFDRFQKVAMAKMEAILLEKAGAGVKKEVKKKPRARL